ncbi:SAV_2336 N-terminal domain-related protein [Streptomyces sp. NPDC091377]|uniref:SAV_2336 N-terminal domain-related protein n=1 Tax=Streptomyces sp. NPDC091377 TaxID=3365995 RepID=UPI00381214F8
MPSEPPGHDPSPLSRLAALLAEASSGDRPAPRELAELLWLAGHMEPERRQQEPGAAEGEPPPPTPRPPVRDTAPPPAPPPAPERPGPPGRPEKPAPPRAPLHLPAPASTPAATGPRHASLLAPAPPMLRHPLGLQRALRPLKRWADAPEGRELDERATAERIARLDADPRWWLPVLRPARERWLRLHLVHDTGPTMPVWRPLVRELHSALAQSGVFRTVTLHRAEPDGTVRGHAAHAPADGRTVTLLISDCTGPQWRKGPAADRWYPTLRRWARRMPLAVIQPLPEHLWRDTALPTTPGRLTAPHPAAPATTLAFTPYDAPDPEVVDGAFPLPVLEPEPGWLANWAALVAAPGGTAYPAAVALLGRTPPDGAGGTDLARLSPEELVLRFRASASPQAFRLAGHVAVGRPELPVMRLVQAALEPEPRPQHLAEVILGGLLTATAGPPGSYAFRPGVREVLLRGLPRTARGRTTELLDRVGGLIDSRAGRAPGEFTASTPAADGTPTTTDGEAFATVSQDSVRQLAGPLSLPRGLRRRYRPVRRISVTGALWQAEDTETGRTVALRLHSKTAVGSRTDAFLRDAERLQGLRHPNLTAVLDFGVEDQTRYVVMEQLDGLGLNTLAAPNGYLLPVPLLVRLGAELAGGLAALHGAGVSHGSVGMSRVVLLPDGTAKLSLYQPGRSSGPAGRSDDLRALGRTLLHLASGTPRVQSPVEPGALRHLPPVLRDRYADTLTLLLSASLADQVRGRERLRDPASRDTARRGHRPRDYRLLGPLRVDPGTGGPDPDLPADLRAMLAMLLLKPGRTVTHDELRWGMWHTADEPKNALSALGAAASRLRTALAPTAAVATRADGYALHTSEDRVDVVRCEDLVRRAEQTRAAGDLATARAQIAEALGLWRGETPLDGVPGPAAETARTRLLQLRLALCRTRAELDLDLNDLDSATEDLGRLVRSHPAREDFRRLYLIALRRSGLLQEALDIVEEYELSGGRSPDLLSLGHELREDMGQPQPGPYEAERGSGPPEDDPFTHEDTSFSRFEAEDEAEAEDADAVERPLPNDEVPESLFPEETEETERAERAERPERPERAERAETAERAERAEGTEEAQEAEEAEEAQETEERDGPVEPERPGGSDAATIVVEFADDPPDPDAHAFLGRALTRLLASGGHSPARFPVRAHTEGWSFPAGPGTPVPEVLLTAIDGFHDLLQELGGTRLCLVHGVGPEEWDAARTALDPTGAHGIVVIPQTMREHLDASRGALLYTLPEPVPPLPAVRGPYPYPPYLPEPSAVTRTVFHDAGGYYEVDLSERRTVLQETVRPARGRDALTARGAASWRIRVPGHVVRDPGVDVDAALRSRLAEVLRQQADRAVPTTTGLVEALTASSVPGCEVRWDVSLHLSGPLRTAVEALRRVDAVVLGFEGTLTRLYSGSEQAGAVRELVGLITELRNPDDALGGAPLPRADAEHTRDGRPHPQDLLRTFHRTPYAQILHLRLAGLEAAALRGAKPYPDAVACVRTLARKGLKLAVVTGTAPQPAESHLDGLRLLGLITGGVHGRDTGGTPLPPDPTLLNRAIARLGVPPERCLVIGSTKAEQTAALIEGAPFLDLGMTTLLEAARGL